MGEDDNIIPDSKRLLLEIAAYGAAMRNMDAKKYTRHVYKGLLPNDEENSDGDDVSDYEEPPIRKFKPRRPILNRAIARMHRDMLANGGGGSPNNVAKKITGSNLSQSAATLPQHFTRETRHQAALASRSEPTRSSRYNQSNDRTRGDNSGPKVRRDLPLIDELPRPKRPRYTRYASDDCCRDCGKPWKKGKFAKGRCLECYYHYRHGKRE